MPWETQFRNKLGRILDEVLLILSSEKRIYYIAQSICRLDRRDRGVSGHLGIYATNLRRIHKSKRSQLMNMINSLVIKNPII